MKQSYLSLVLLSALTAIPFQAQAWSKNGLETLSDQQPPPVDDRKGEFELDYLFWKPYQEDLNFSVKFSQTNDPSGGISASARVKNPDFNLSSGIRLGFGGYTADHWDIKVRGTYYYSDSHEETQSTDVTSLSPSFFPQLEGSGGTKASANWRINFGLLDLTLGRETYLTKRFSIHPFVGVRNVWIREKMNGSFKGIPFGSNDNTLFLSTYKLRNNVWGIGPRAGLDSGYYLTNNWSFHGGFSGAFVLGNFRARQNLEGQVGSGNSGIQPLNLNVKDSQDMIRANLDGYLGVGWDKWFNDNKNRIYIALLCETSYWFGINQLMDFNISTGGGGGGGGMGGPTSVSTDKRHGDLAFFGGTIHFQFDF